MMHRVTVLLGTLAIVTAQVGYSQATYPTIYSFGKLPDGAQPHASVVIGAQGALFGTTFTGGAYGGGTVFELSNPTGTAWTESVLYNFSCPGCEYPANGQYPQANVVFGPNGALYGTTEGGGAGGGAIFELAPPSAPGGAWTESVLYSFNSSRHAQVNAPHSPVFFGPGGLLYSTAYGNPDYASGGVVALLPPVTTGGTWKEYTIAKFGSPLAAGENPLAGLVAQGTSLFGTNYYSNGAGSGAVYELSPPASPGGAWTLTAVYTFTGLPHDGAYPLAPLTVGASGVLYGTTAYGGTGACSTDGQGLVGCGTVFQLTPPTTPCGAWTESVIYSFTGINGDGILPAAGVLIGKNGALYGTTQEGGDISASSPCQGSYYVSAGCGTVFELTPPTSPGGAWTETILHSFTGQSGDGSLPVAGLVISSTGVLYGTTSEGGAYNKGTVFAIEP